MTIKGSTLASEASCIHNLKSGDLYFYDDYLISEIHEGIVVVKEDLLEILSLIDEHFCDNKPYGLISHRAYSYSVNLHDILSIADKLRAPVVNAVVAYSNIALKNFELEKRILKLKGESFSNLEEAIFWTKQEVLKASQKSLN